MKIKCVCGAVAASAIGLSTVAHAQTEVPVANHSFSTQVLADGDYVVGSIADWTITSGMGGVFNPTSSYFPAEAPDGSNTGFIREGALTQDVGTAVGLATYILQVQAGLRSDLTNADFSIQILLDGDVVSDFTGGAGLTPGSFGTFSTEYTTTAADAGKNVTVRLSANNDTTQMNFDNVHLNYSLVPTPGALALLGVAGLGLRRRRRG